MSRSSGVYKQTGISLIVVLLLLLVMTLLGLAVLRSTLMEERMSANMYDRSLAFQATEGALREAEKVIQTAAGAGQVAGYVCPTAAVCDALPSNTYTGNGAGCAAGTQECWVDASMVQKLQVGSAQYYIQYLGQRTSEDQLSLNSSVSQNQYGGSGGTSLEHYYRVTARSVNPAVAGQRALVVLQTNVTVK
ncbi:pilus assembly PilX family protein [Xanthomonas perforans]|uniref:pilus assembly PilX family protein n=1 Tax=Xanthomonas perforans TaxID=442694 RepID=UPI00115EC087|nr:PilX N-terminal domain-containing pilus assembly protein [Xanthomonas perforans]TQV41431.1 PilX protein [Xanthomonas perforans]